MQPYPLDFPICVSLPTRFKNSFRQCGHKDECCNHEGPICPVGIMWHCIMSVNPDLPPISRTSSGEAEGRYLVVAALCVAEGVHPPIEAAVSAASADQRRGRAGPRARAQRIRPRRIRPRSSGRCLGLRAWGSPAHIRHVSWAPFTCQDAFGRASVST